MELKNLAQESPQAIALHYVALEDLADTFLDGNSKKHDIDKLIDSIQRYGFRDPIAFDSNLNGGDGGIIEGNGRLEALTQMKAQGQDMPKGLKEGWLLPVLFGLDATSEAEAQAFSIEHNWAVMWGAETIDFQTAIAIFDQEALIEQLEFLQEESSLPLSLEGQDISGLLDDLIKDLNQQSDNGEPPNVDDEGGTYQEQFAIAVICESEEEQESVYNSLVEQGYKCKVLTV